MKTSTDTAQRLRKGVKPTEFHCQATGIGSTVQASLATGRARAVRAGTLTVEQAYPAIVSPVALGRGY